jgi:transcriptional regulator with XRE-family HTH domain
MSFAKRLADLRMSKGMSLQQVADKVGISKAHVWNLEKGQADNPSMELVLKFAELFRVRVADLVGENPDADDQEPEMVAMFRDLKKLDTRDRDMIRGLMKQLNQKSKKDNG